MQEPRITITGNVTKDPAFKVGASGTSYARFTVVTNPRNKTKDGEWEDGTPIFWNCVAFDTLADHIADSVTKGDRLIVQGTLTRETWQDKETGQDREMLKLTCEDVALSIRFRAATVSKPTRDAA